MGAINWRGPNIVKEGLVLYLDLGSPNSFYPSTNTTVKDISSFTTNNGTLQNGAIYSENGSGSAQFDGVNSNIIVLSSSTLNNLPLNSFTVSAWINPVTGGEGNVGRIFNKRGLNVSLNGWIMYVNSTSGIGGEVLKSSGGANSRTTGSTLANTWSHVTMTYDESGDRFVRLYINAIQPSYDIFTQGSSGNIVDDSQGDLMIGESQDLIRGFDGKMTLFTVYNRILSEEEIFKNYTQTKSRFGL